MPCELIELDYGRDDVMTHRLILVGADLSEALEIENIVDKKSITTIGMALERMRSDLSADALPYTVCHNRGNKPECSSMLNGVRIYEGSALHTVLK
ncbi:hypothetical protein N7451_008180 [Penicillium sp. IBT 35674x]|nr:hypothetical protein N7451_008180 [Penicillium sp. IBT 35674x]